MPTNKNAMTRYALIDRMLASRHQAFSIQDITDKLAERLPEYGQEAVSKRCVEKDLKYLEYDSPFDVEIEEYWIDASDKNDRPYRKRCLRYADPTFSIFKPKLTQDEKTVLHSALETLGSFEGLDNFEWLSDLKTRLNLEERSPIISFSKNLLDNSTLFARLFTAIQLNQVIILEYNTFQNREIRDVSITPHLLKEFNNRWFLIGSASDTGRTLTFALDRILDFRVDYRMTPLYAPNDIAERFEEIIGVTYIDSHPILDIIFWVSDKSKDYVVTKPLHNSQTNVNALREHELRGTYPHLDGGKFFKIKCRENYELIRELMSFGPELLVISPIHIKETIQQKIEGMLHLYQRSFHK